MILTCTTQVVAGSISTNVMVPREAMLVGVRLAMYTNTTDDANGMVIQASLSGNAFTGVGVSDQILMTLLGANNEDAILGGNGFVQLNDFNPIPAAYMRPMSKVYLHLFNIAGTSYGSMQVYLQEIQ